MSSSCHGCQSDHHARLATYYAEKAGVEQEIYNCQVKMSELQTQMTKHLTAHAKLTTPKLTDLQCTHKAL